MIITLKTYIKTLTIIFFLLFIGKNSFALTVSHLKVGLAFSSVKKYDQFTQQVINGILAAKLVFEKDNPNFKIDFTSYPFQPNDLSSAYKQANKICADKPMIVIGGEMSEDALMLGQILNSCKIVLISPTATNPKVSENRSYIFRMSVPDDIVAKKMAEFVFSNFKKQMIGVVDDTSLPYSDYLSKSFINNYSKLEKNPLIIKKVLRVNLDYSSQIEDFIKKNVKVVVMLTYDVDLKRFISQAVKKNYFPIYIGSDGWGSNISIENFMKSFGANGNKLIAYRNNYSKENIYNKLYAEFTEAYKSKFNKIPNSWNIIGFDSAWITFKGLSKLNNNFSQNNIRNQISKSHNIKLLTTNNFSFSENNSPNKDVYIFRISATGSSFITTLRSNS